MSTVVVCRPTRRTTIFTTLQQAADAAATGQGDRLYPFRFGSTTVREHYVDTNGWVLMAYGRNEINQVAQTDHAQPINFGGNAHTLASASQAAAIPDLGRLRIRVDNGSRYGLETVNATILQRFRDYVSLIWSSAQNSLWTNTGSVDARANNEGNALALNRQIIHANSFSPIVWSGSTTFSLGGTNFGRMYARDGSLADSAQFQVWARVN